MIASASRARLVALLGAALALAGLMLGLTPAPAHAAASVSVTVEGRGDLVGVADPTYVTRLQVSGTGFQSIQNGFGGIYVMFGWVGEGWRPSEGGTTGADYQYVPDDEANPTGYVSFVTFPGSSTAYAANGGELAADGSWSAVLTVPSATFTALDRSGTPTQVDCTVVQCGVITIGAHGVKNANNETFTPVSFQNLYETEAAAPAAPVVEESAAPVADPTPAPTQTTYVTEAPVPLAAAPASAEPDQLLITLLWIAGGVGVLAVAAIVFVVWAVLSARRRPATTGGGGVA